MTEALQVFRLRAWARAYLWAASMIGLHEAVDELQDAGDRYGLDPDAAQQIIATEFKGAKC